MQNAFCDVETPFCYTKFIPQRVNGTMSTSTLRGWWIWRKFAFRRAGKLERLEKNPSWVHIWSNVIITIVICSVQRYCMQSKLEFESGYGSCNFDIHFPTYSHWRTMVSWLTIKPTCNIKWSVEDTQCMTTVKVCETLLVWPLQTHWMF